MKKQENEIDILKRQMGKLEPLQFLAEAETLSKLKDLVSGGAQGEEPEKQDQPEFAPLD